MHHRIRSFTYAGAVLLALISLRMSAAILTVTTIGADPPLGTDDCLPATGAANCATLRGAIDHALASPDAASTILFDTSLDGVTLTVSSFSNDPGCPTTSETNCAIAATPGREFGPSAFFIDKPKAITIDASVSATGQPRSHGVTLARDTTQPDFRLFDIGSGASLTLRGLTLTGGVARGGSAQTGGGALGAGGAIFNQGTLLIDRCTLNGNLAQGGNSYDPASTGSGGGGAGVGTDAPSSSSGGAPNGAFTYSTAGGFGGGGGYGGGRGGFGGGGGWSTYGGQGGFGGGSVTSPTSSDGGAGMGGAIFNDAGDVHLVNATLYANVASGGTGGINATVRSYGGGIYNYNGSVTIEFSTLSGNSVVAGNGFTVVDGGAVYSTGDGNCNATGAAPSGGNVCSGTTATLTVANSIAANNTGAASDIVSSTISGGFDNYTASNTLTGTVALGAFTDAGGFLGVLIPPSGSPAINLATCDANTIDQRGMIRPDPASASLATPCDVGAVEANSITSDTIFTNGFEP